MFKYKTKPFHSFPLTEGVESSWECCKEGESERAGEGKGREGGNGDPSDEQEYCEEACQKFIEALERSSHQYQGTYYSFFSLLIWLP